METLRIETNYGLLGNSSTMYPATDAQALAHVETLEQMGYEPAAGVAQLEDLLNGTIFMGPERLAEGAIIGPYAMSGQVMPGFMLYETSEESPRSIANTLERSVRLSSARAEAVAQNWELRAKITPKQVEPIPLLEPHIVKPTRAAQTRVEQVWSILTNSYFRRGKLDALEPYQEQMQALIANAIDNSGPVQIILPTIPFKDQNPTTTGQPVGAVDLGEHAFIAQLRDLVCSIQAVYEPGLHVELIADGQIYREIFTHATAEEVAAYTQSVGRIVRNYGLSDYVHITDFSEIIAGDADFDSHRRGVENILLTQRGTRVRGCLRALQAGMLVNCQINDYSMNEVEYMKAQAIAEWPASIRRLTSAGALSYAAFLITASQRCSLERHFPQALRATVHPKPAPQLPLHLVSRRNAIFPYNGMPVVKGGAAGLRDGLRIMRLSSLLATDGEFYRCHDEGGNTLYYAQVG